MDWMILPALSMAGKNRMKHQVFPKCRWQWLILVDFIRILIYVWQMEKYRPSEGLCQTSLSSESRG